MQWQRACYRAATATADYTWRKVMNRSSSCHFEAGLFETCVKERLTPVLDRQHPGAKFWRKPGQQVPNLPAGRFLRWQLNQQCRRELFAGLFTITVDYAHLFCAGVVKL